MIFFIIYLPKQTRIGFLYVKTCKNTFFCVSINQQQWKRDLEYPPIFDCERSKVFFYSNILFNRFPIEIFNVLNIQTSLVNWFNSMSKHCEQLFLYTLAAFSVYTRVVCTLENSCGKNNVKWSVHPKIFLYVLVDAFCVRCRILFTFIETLYRWAMCLSWRTNGCVCAKIMTENVFCGTFLTQIYKTFVHFLMWQPKQRNTSETLNFSFSNNLLLYTSPLILHSRIIKVQNK